jgi:hypothetical protein
MLSGDNLAIFLFFIGTAITIALAAMNAAGWRHPLLIRSLFGLSVVCVVIGVTGSRFKTVSPAVTGIVTQVATNPVAWFVILMFAIATLLLRPTDGSRTSGAPKPATSLDFVENILIITYSPDSPALLLGTASETFDRITMALDYSAYFTGFRVSGWSQRRRIKLASFNPFEKGIRYEATIISRAPNADGKTAALMWGNDPNKDIVSSDKYQARLAFIAPGKEQYFYFMLVSTYLADGQRTVTILNQDDFTFRQEWGKE